MGNRGSQEECNKEGGLGLYHTMKRWGGTFQARQGTAVCSEPIWFVVVGVDVVVGGGGGIDDSSVLDSGDVTGKWVCSSLILRDGKANPFR